MITIHKNTNETIKQYPVMIDLYPFLLFSVLH